MNKDIVFVLGDDWQGMYIDGKLALEDHSLHPCDVLRKLGIDYDYVPVNDEWMWEQGNLPSNLNEVVIDE